MLISIVSMIASSPNTSTFTVSWPRLNCHVDLFLTIQSSLGPAREATAKNDPRDIAVLFDEGGASVIICDYVPIKCLLGLPDVFVYRDIGQLIGRI